MTLVIFAIFHEIFSSFESFELSKFFVGNCLGLLFPDCISLKTSYDNFSFLRKGNGAYRFAWLLSIKASYSKSFGIFPLFEKNCLQKVIKLCGRKCKCKSSSLLSYQKLIVPAKAYCPTSLFAFTGYIHDDTL